MIIKDVKTIIETFQLFNTRWVKWLTWGIQESKMIIFLPNQSHIKPPMIEPGIQTSTNIVAVNELIPV